VTRITAPPRRTPPSALGIRVWKSMRATQVGRTAMRAIRVPVGRDAVELGDLGLAPEAEYLGWKRLGVDRDREVRIRPQRTMRGVPSSAV
jgi:hypothetical protein